VANTYTPQTWTDGVSSASAARMGVIETGVQGAWARELAYNQITSNVSCTATTEATANTIVTASAVTFDGSTAAVIEFFCPNFDASDSPTFSLFLYDGTSIGFLMQRSVTAGTAMGPIYVSRRLTPSAASHTYSIRGDVSSGSGVSVKAGAGGAGSVVPAFIRITRA